MDPLLAIAFLVVNLYTQQKDSWQGLTTTTDSIPQERLSIHSKGRVQGFTDLETDTLKEGTAQSKASLTNTFFGFRHQERLEGLSKDRVPLSTIEHLKSKSRAVHADDSLASEIQTDNQLVESQMQLNHLTEGKLGSKHAPSLDFDSFMLTFPATNGCDTNTSTIAQTLDNLSYRTLGFGFPLLTIGILSGAVWANEAWGSYWSWDPKETWALITWLVFAIYLHTRLTKGWKGTGPALIATGGFIIVWICYLGVNLLGTGLHSYGWFQRS